MSNFGGPYSSFETDLKEKLLPLSNKLEKLQNELQGLIFNSLENAKTSTAYWNKINAEMSLIYKEMVALQNKWSAANIPDRYKDSIKGIQASINNTKRITNTAKLTANQLLNTNASAQMMQALYTDAAASFNSAATTGLNNMKRLTSMTQQLLVSESLIDLTIAEGFRFGDLRKASRSLYGELYSKLLAQVEGKQFVQAGKYHYRPEYYAEMVARVKFHEAHSIAALAQAKNYGTDLVQVSSHNTTTEICQQYEAKIYSVSGNDKRFPLLGLTPPYHVNCLHLILPTFVSAMEVQGTLESFSAFSKGKIDAPPIPAGFIPLANRGVA